MVGALSTGIVRLPVRFMRIVIASASLTLNDHIGQASPINAYNEFGLTVPATENRCINGVTLKRDRVVSWGLYEAPLWVAFDNAQKNSTLHAILPRSQYPRSRLSRLSRDTLGARQIGLQRACGWQSGRGT